MAQLIPLSPTGALPWIALYVIYRVLNIIICLKGNQMKLGNGYNEKNEENCKLI